MVESTRDYCGLFDTRSNLPRDWESSLSNSDMALVLLFFI